MENETKRISAEEFATASACNYADEEHVNWHGLKITIKHRVGLTDMMTIVQTATESAFSESGVFVPEVVEFAFHSGIIDKYTNVDLPENLEERYSLIYDSGIIDSVLQVADVDQLQSMEKAIHRKVKYACDSNLSLVNRKAEELLDAIGGVEAEMNKLFSKISPDEMEELVKAVSANGLDEEAIVKAYLNQTKKQDAEDADQ